MAKKKNNKSRKIIIILIIVLIILVISLVVLVKRNKSISQPNSEKALLEYKKEQTQRKLEDLSNKNEQERMQAYCADFFRLIDNNDYEEAYKLLYSEYKENYFPTLANFKKYFKDYFPSDFALSYENIERLGDIYVLMVSLSDTVNGSYGHNFKLYVVIKENSLNNYVISFSRNSAVEEG